MDKKKLVGGQAVLEGVMMRCGERIAVACRRSDNSISVYRECRVPAAQRFAPLGWPIFRGMVAFFEALVIGVRALNISAAEALAEENEELTAWHSFAMVALGLCLGVALFFVLPTYLVRFLPQWPPLALNIAEGITRLSIFLAYIYLITRWGDVKRVFEYHGAEHKVIYGYEQGETLDLERIAAFSPRHPRCGTSFILTVMLVSIILFAFFGWPTLLQRILLRLFLLPLVAGISYEAIRYASRSNSRLVCFLTAPGMWLQSLTTREPDQAQIEVASRALQAVIEEPAVETKQETTTAGESNPSELMTGA